MTTAEKKIRELDELVVRQAQQKLELRRRVVELEKEVERMKKILLNDEMKTIVRERSLT